MKAYDKRAHTPLTPSKRTVVVGGGNVAMDAARCALRLGAEVTVVYRRGEEEMPARAEERHHAREEGIVFQTLTNPTEIRGAASVESIVCDVMKLGETDASGRGRPVKTGETIEIACDRVIMAIGSSPNPLLRATTPDLNFNRRGCVDADELTGKTNRPNVYAGGDAVTGAATVILAMGAGREAARQITVNR
jgi:glutamate synthase (NADPH/NADH) small chain